MHGKAQREPARQSVVLDCKLVPLHNTCQTLPAVCYITSMRFLHSCECWLFLVLNLCRLVGEQKLANRFQPFLDLSLPDLVVCRGVPVD